MRPSLAIRAREEKMTLMRPSLALMLGSLGGTTAVLSTAELLAFERVGHICARRFLDHAETRRIRRVLDEEFDCQRLKTYTQKLQVHGIDTKGLDLPSARATLTDFCDENELELPFWQLFVCLRGLNPQRLGAVKGGWQCALLCSHPANREARWSSPATAEPPPLARGAAEARVWPRPCTGCSRSPRV